MKHEDVINFLFDILSRFDYHPKLLEELSDLISGSGYEKVFRSLFLIRLNFLDMRGIRAIEGHEEYESLGSGLFSMHLAKKGFNIRILYGFLPNGMPTLLLAFYERAGKRSTDYSSYLPPALSRLRERKDDFENAQK